jgi:hypothetical protein
VVHRADILILRRYGGPHLVAVVVRKDTLWLSKKDLLFEAIQYQTLRNTKQRREKPYLTDFSSSDVRTYIHQIPFAVFSFHFASEDTAALVSFCPSFKKKKVGQGTGKRNNQCRNLILARVPNSFAFRTTFVVSFGVVVYCALGARTSGATLTEMHGHHSFCIRALCEVWICAADDLIRWCPLLVRCYKTPAFSSKSTEVSSVSKYIQSVCAMMIFGRAT